MSAKKAQVTVLYPSGDGATFDMEYYLAKHMPLVMSKWKESGLTGYSVLKFSEGAPYAVQATLNFSSLADFHKAAGGEHTAEIMGDVKNFSNKEPTLMPAEVMGAE